jgi:hypothetical protein
LPFINSGYRKTDIEGLGALSYFILLLIIVIKFDLRIDLVKESGLESHELTHVNPEKIIKNILRF